MEGYNLLTDDEKVIFHFRQLCTRLVEVDSECNDVKGCPASFVAQPVIEHWRNQHRFTVVPESVRTALSLMLSEDGQGRWCEFEGIKYRAEKFLETNPNPLERITK